MRVFAGERAATVTDWALIVGTGLAAFLFTAWFRRVAVRHALLDIPNVRSSHERATPRGGGAAIVFGFAGASAILFIAGRLPVCATAAMAGGGIVAAIGFLDDFRDINAVFRLVVHVTAAVWAVAWLGGFPALIAGPAVYEPDAIGYFLGAVFLVWLLNLYNFMDGIDGIAAAEAISVAGSAAVLLLWAGEPAMALWMACLVAATGGFLVWNWPPARIFMGDVGSSFLGYVLGVFALTTAWAGALSIWTWIILLGVFLADASVTLVRRMWRGDRWYAAHRSHAYQHAARRWGSHRRVTVSVLALNFFWLLPLAALSGIAPRSAWWLTIVALMPLVIGAVVLGAGRKDGGHTSMS